MIVHPDAEVSAASLSDGFERFSGTVARLCASQYAFAAAVALVLAWAAVGPLYHWSEAHSLLINTATTIQTFLMGFLILASNARSELAIQLKLDAIIAASSAKNDYMAAELLTARELAEHAERLRADTG